jgi:NADH:ubiquinone oxidoreductase subunit E
LKVKADLNKVMRIIDSYKEKKGMLVNILQDVQAEYNFLPKDILVQLAEKLETPLSKIYSVATFYTAFSLKPRGKHLISVCLGTACFVKGGRKILERIERDLGIEPGETTKDLRFSLETVRCLGCCGLSPVVRIDDKIYGQMRQERIPEILNRYK